MPPSAFPVTIAVIVVTVLVSLQGFRDPYFIGRHLFDIDAILKGRQWRRLITSGFLHGGLAHLGFNMFSFWSFGRILEYALGAPFLLIVYFVSILGGNLLALALHRHEVYRALGASGGVSGVIFATVFLFPGGAVRIFPVPIAIPSWLFAIVFVAGSFIAMRRRADNIGHDAHLGGALCGLLAATLLEPNLVERSPVLFVAVLALTAFLIWYGRTFPAAMDPWNPGGAARWRQWLQDRQGDVGRRMADRENERLDELLAKISEGGVESLTPRERDELERLSRRRRGG